jgi:hypothetical protein
MIIINNLILNLEVLYYYYLNHTILNINYQKVKKNYHK